MKDPGQDVSDVGRKLRGPEEGEMKLRRDRVRTRHSDE